MDALAANIVNRLFSDEEIRLTIVFNRDDFLSRPDGQEASCRPAQRLRSARRYRLRHRQHPAPLGLRTDVLEVRIIIQDQLSSQIFCAKLQ